MNAINAVGPAERNKTPIFEQLVPLLADTGQVLEIGAGNGTHTRHARRCLPGVRWQPSEHPARITELRQGLAQEPQGLAPLSLDVTADWPRGPYAAVYGANIAHIMPWPAVEALFAGSARVLESGGLLCLYGPFFDDEVATATSNLVFDTRLRAHDPTMGLRRAQALDQLARAHGMMRRHDWGMPANNRLLVWGPVS